VAPERLVIHDDADVPTSQIAEYESTRRDLLRRGIAVGGATVAASSVPLLLGVRNAFAQASGDRAILMSAIGLEQVAVFAYRAAIGSGALDPATKKVARRFKTQEQEHADGLRTALTGMGGTAPAAPQRVGEVDRALGSLGIRTPLGSLKHQKQILIFAIELEMAAVAAYYDAHQKLESPKLLTTGAQIMANEGQHLVILRSALGRDPLPNAFESGEASA